MGAAGLPLTADRAAFARDGFVVLEDGVLDAVRIEVLRERFAALFAGEWGTGIRPDEVNWQAERDPEDRTRQLCNAWKADRAVADAVLDPAVGRLACELAGWDGARLLQDNVLWKPPGARSLGMHQDAAYLDYLVPGEIVTVWMALDDTAADAGTIEYVPGSHRWPAQPENRAEFHAPDDWLAPARRALAPGAELRTVPVVVRAGGAAVHHGRTLHGSGPNRADVHRRAVVSHLVPLETRFHPEHVDPVYSRYRLGDDLRLHDAFFPVVWQR